MMSWFTNRVKRSPLVAFFVLVFGVLWLLFLLLRPLVPPLVAVFIGSWLPNAIGALVTGVAGGRTGLRELFGKVVLWRVSLKWYTIALFGPIAVAFLAIGLYVLFGNAMPDFAPAHMMLPIVLAGVFTGAMGEELGWRGTALPRLQARSNALTSSLLLGVLWGLYHLPAWLMPGTPQEGLPFIAFMVGAVPFSVFISWVFNHTDGSLIMVFLSHFAFNFIGNALGIFGVPALFWLAAGIWWVVAVVIISFDWARFTQPAASPYSSLRQHNRYPARTRRRT